MPNSFYKSRALWGIYCLAVLLSSGCLRTQAVKTVGASAQSPAGPDTTPKTDSYLHFSTYLRSTPVASSIAVLGGFTYFACGDATVGVELCRTDGTAAGTTLVKDLNPGPESSSPTGMT